ATTKALGICLYFFNFTLTVYLKKLYVDLPWGELILKKDLNRIMDNPNIVDIKQYLIIIIFGFVGWALCGATIGIGRSVTSMENTLIIHALGAPVIFGTLSFIYFKKFN
ncbi:MAG: hypothetical protein ACXACY_28040, partial [Candidatus Hodarchaeales archaeon]